MSFIFNGQTNNLLKQCHSELRDSCCILFLVCFISVVRGLLRNISIHHIKRFSFQGFAGRINARRTKTENRLEKFYVSVKDILIGEFNT